jgi:hypothetical protein
VLQRRSHSSSFPLSFSQRGGSSAPAGFGIERRRRTEATKGRMLLGASAADDVASRRKIESPGPAVPGSGAGPWRRRSSGSGRRTRSGSPDREDGGAEARGEPETRRWTAGLLASSADRQRKVDPSTSAGTPSFAAPCKPARRGSAGVGAREGGRAGLGGFAHFAAAVAADTGAGTVRFPSPFCASGVGWGTCWS